MVKIWKCRKVLLACLSALDYGFFQMHFPAFQLKFMEGIVMFFQVDKLLKRKEYDIYNNECIGDNEIRKIADTISADKSIDLNECFDLSKCSSKFCWFNFLKILEIMPEEDRIRGLSILFVLLQDYNWPTFQKTMELFETIDMQVVESYLNKYLAQAYAEDDEEWISNMHILAEKLNIMINIKKN